MRVSLPFLLQIQGASARGDEPPTESAEAPGLRQSLGGWVALTFQQIVAAITTGYHTEHHDDDTHKDIHCDSISERGRDAAMGVWVTATTADATAFTGSGTMTWTVDIADQANVSYMLVGKTMTLNVRLDSTSVGGAVSNILRMRIPGGYIAARQAAVPCLITDNTLAFNTLCQMRVLANSNLVEFLRYDAANWTASANLTFIVAAQLSFEVA